MKERVSEAEEQLFAATALTVSNGLRALVLSNFRISKLSKYSKAIYFIC
jgi:hypothetical protein